MALVVLAHSITPFARSSLFTTVPALPWRLNLVWLAEHALDRRNLNRTQSTHYSRKKRARSSRAPLCGGISSSKPSRFLPVSYCRRSEYRCVRAQLLCVARRKHRGRGTSHICDVWRSFLRHIDCLTSNPLTPNIDHRLCCAGDDDDGGAGEGEEEEGEHEEKMPSCSDYVMHFITLFWKIIFAFVPPQGMQRSSNVCTEAERRTPKMQIHSNGACL